jgi:spore coat protein U-like protein
MAGTALGQRCDVTGVPVHFGDYDTLSPQHATGNITVACTRPTVVAIKLDPGQNSGGRFHPRKMLSIRGTATLAYNLYVDAGFTRVWGDGTGNTHAPTGLGNFTIYGRIPGQQNVPVGLYSDMVTVIVEW